MGCVMNKPDRISRDDSEDIVPWEHVRTVPLDTWARSEANKLGFSTAIDYVSRKGQQPWCTEGRQVECLLPAPLDESELDVKYIYDELLIRDNCTWRSTRVHLHTSYKCLLPNKVKATTALDSVRVIGCRGDCVVTQVTRTDMTFDMIVVNTASSKVLGIYQESYADQPFLWDCFISPDTTTLLLKPNLCYALRFHVAPMEDVLKVVRLDRRVGSYRCVQALFPDQALDLILTFDPRCRNSRIALANLNKRDRHVLCIYQIPGRNMLARVSVPQFQRIQNLTYSPGGDVLACLVMSCEYLGSSSSPAHFNILSVLVFSSDSLTLVHKLPSFGTESLTSLTPGALFPVFSRNENYLAMGSGSGGGISRVEIYRVPPPMRLEYFCRRLITTYLTQKQIEHLPLDETLKNYLLFRPAEE